MRRDNASESRDEDRRDRLSDRVGAVMNEINALLRERRSDDVLRAREVLADAYHCATERRRSRRAASSPTAAPGSARADYIGRS